MERVERVIGWMSDPAVGDAVHQLAHRGLVEHVDLAPGDEARRRLRVVTDRGSELGIALDRPQRLGDGAVVVLTDDRAVVVRSAAREWLRLRPAGVREALALGHRAGHLHWTIELTEDELAVAIEGSAEDYLARLTDLDGIEVVERAGQGDRELEP